MADENEFIERGLQRSQIDEFFADELGRAGYGGMEIAPTPMGDQIVLKAEKPGMVIGKGGKNIRKITSELETKFDLDDPQIDVQEVDEPDLNARIVADRLANALERGWYFRKAGHTTIDRIMDAGALGAEIVLSGKVTGARSRVAKFSRGYIKHNGEPADEIVDEGQGVAVMKLGTIGVTVKIIPPNADLPDDFRVVEDADVEDLVVEEEAAGVDELLEGTDEADAEASPEEFEEVETPAGGEEFEEELVEEEPVEEAPEAEPDAAPESEEAESEEAEPEEAEPEEAEPEEAEPETGELDEDVEAEAEELLEEMEAADEPEEAASTDDEAAEAADDEDADEAAEAADDEDGGEA